MIHSQDKLIAYREQLREQYTVGRINDLFNRGFHQEETLETFRESVALQMDEQARSNGPDEGLFNMLITRRWFDVCKPLCHAERVQRIEECLESVDLLSGDFLQSFFARSCAILNAKPRLWKTRGQGYIAIAEKIEGFHFDDPIVILCRGPDGRELTTYTVDDQYLRQCMVTSWKYAKDRDIAYAARAQLLWDFWEAWEAHVLESHTQFDQHSFVAGSMAYDIPAGGRRYCGVTTWDSLHLVLIIDRNANASNAYGEGWALLADSHNRKIYCSPELVSNTQKLREWTAKQQSLGYTNFSSACLKSKGPEEALSEWLIRKTPWFQMRLPSRLPARTLGEMLFLGMCELDLDQAFFGSILITARDYIMQVKEQP